MLTNNRDCAPHLSLSVNCSRFFHYVALATSNKDLDGVKDEIDDYAGSLRDNTPTVSVY